MAPRPKNGPRSVSRPSADAPQIIVRGAREHNLRNINVELPRDKLVVFTGLSGSGKSSASRSTPSTPRANGATSSPCRRTPASSSARWTSPTSTSSRGCHRPSRSTRSRPVATRAPPSARSPRSTTTSACCTPASVCSTARTTARGCSARRPSRSSTASCCSPRAPASRCSHRSCAAARASTTRCSRTSSGQGFVRARIDGEVVDIDEFLKRDERLARYEQHTIEVVVDRLVRREGIERRLTDSLETALQPGRRRRRGRDRRPGRRGERDAHVLPAPGLPDVRDELRRAGAAQLLVQLAVRRVRDVRRPRHHVRGRPRARHPRSRPVDQRRCHRAVAQRPHAVLHAHARGRGRRRTASTSTPRGRSSRAKQQKVILDGVEGQPHGQVQNRYGRHAPVLHGLRGRHPVDQAAPRGRPRATGRASSTRATCASCHATRATAPA